MVKLGIGKAQKLISVKELHDGLGPSRSKALPLFMTLTGCDSTSSLKGHSKGQCFKAWKKCITTVIDAMVDLMDHPFMHLELNDWRFKALETFFIQVYGGGETSANILRETFAKLRTWNVYHLLRMHYINTA